MQRGGLAALGALAALGQAPTELWFLTLGALAVWLWLWPRGTMGFGHGFWLGLGYFAVTLRWIVSPFLVDVAAHGWMAPFAVVAMAAGGGVFWGLAAGIAGRIWGAQSLPLTLCLAGVEVLRALILTGFPWALLGHIWIDTPLAQLAGWVGPHGLTLLTVVLAWTVMALSQRVWWAAVGPLGAGALALLLAPPGAAPADGPVIRLVQPNAPQDEKWDPVLGRPHTDRLLALTAQGARPDLIVWPEMAVTSLLEYADTTRIATAARGVPLIFGIARRDGARYYNTATLLDGQGMIAQSYDKAHILPFGEYIPGGDWLARLGITAFAPSHGGGYSHGAGDHLLDLPGIGPARVLICYEGIFAEEIALSAPRPRLMVLITNDAWFGHGAGPEQHLAQARLRAIEQGLPMVRVANTGISALIDPWGRVATALPLNTAGALDVALPAALAPPLYARLGDTPAIVFLLAALAALAPRRRKP